MDLDEAIEMVIKEMKKEHREYAQKVRDKVWPGFDHEDKPLY